MRLGPASYRQPPRSKPPRNRCANLSYIVCYDPQAAQGKKRASKRRKKRPGPAKAEPEKAAQKNSEKSGEEDKAAAVQEHSQQPGEQDKAAAAQERSQQPGKQDKAAATQEHSQQPEKTAAAAAQGEAAAGKLAAAPKQPKQPKQPKAQAAQAAQAAAQREGPTVEMPTVEGARVDYRGARLFLKPMHWRIHVPAGELRAHGNSWTRQFGTTTTPPTTDKQRAAFQSALALIDDLWAKKVAAASA